jgi:CBS domain-containing protein
MLRLRDIMTAEVITLDPDTTLSQAIDLLAEKHVSGAPVVKGREPIGVISATDLLGFEASNPRFAKEPEEDVEWADWGDAEAEPEDEEREPAAFFTETPDESDGDIVESIVETSDPSHNLLDDYVVAEVMTRRLHALPPDRPVEQAADLMRRAGIHRVLVVDGGDLVGIVTSSDIARAVAEHRLTRTTYVFNRDRDFRESHQ